MVRGEWAVAVCRHVQYSGQVQGVGFRYAVQRLASGFPVAGFVRNLRDGSVEVVAEGAAEDVERFLTSIARQMAPYITQSQARDEPSAGYKGFDIRY